MSEPTSDFLREFIARGYFHQCTDLEALDALAPQGPHHRLYRLRRHRAISLHVGNLVQIMMLRRLQQHRPPPDRADGRRHHQDRRSLGQGREPQAAERRRTSTPTSPASARSSTRFLELRRRPDRCVMVNNADWLDDLAYIPFLRDYRPPFLDQPHADLRQRQAAARARAAADLPRVQLHDPAGLRLPGARPAPRLRAADGRLRPVGQYRQRRRARPAGRRTARCSA